MLRVAVAPASPADPGHPFRDCSCCGGRYPVRRKGMRLYQDGAFVGDICPECVLTGPAGAASRIRSRLAEIRNPGGEGEGGKRSSLERRLERRARLLEGTPSFPLSARQAAVRETRERR